MKTKRVFWIVLDSFGVGELPDAADFGDEGSNTLRACAESGKLNIPNMIKLGLGNIEGVECIEKAEKPLGAFCRLNEVSKGKDTTTGHWELAGLVSEQAFPTYPEGFPEEVIGMFKEATGLDVLCNKPYSGTQLIMDYGKEHVETGKPIVYTSADSVFQVAAHEDVIPLEKLYEICEKECEHTYFIQTLDNLYLDLPKSVGLVGITAGASTPNNIIEEVQKYVRINF